MWQKNFKEYTRSIAFNLQLSDVQCRGLMRIHKVETIKKREEKSIVISRVEANRTYTILERKGLIEHDGDEYITTQAGKHVVGLLLHAFDEEELVTIAPQNKYTQKELDALIPRP